MATSKELQKTKHDIFSFRISEKIEIYALRMYADMMF